MQVDVGRPERPGKMALAISHLQARDAEIQAALVGDARHTLENASPMESAGNRNTKPASGPEDADIEQRLLGKYGRAHANKCAERAQDGRRHEVRQAGIHAVVERGQVVAELVGQQDGHQSERKRQPAQRFGRMPPERAHTY